MVEVVNLQVSEWMFIFKFVFEIGDSANLTISFAGELLQNAEELIRMGLHPSEIISGYNKAITKVFLFFPISFFFLKNFCFTFLINQNPNLLLGFV